MRKIIAILLTAVLLMLALCACGGRSTEPVSMDGESYEILDTGAGEESSGDAGQSGEKKSEKKQPNKVAKWFKELKIEFKKVIWPSKKTVINNTSVVLAVVAASAVLVGLLDNGFLGLLRLIYKAISGI